MAFSPVFPANGLQNPNLSGLETLELAWPFVRTVIFHDMNQPKYMPPGTNNNPTIMAQMGTITQLCVQKGAWHHLWLRVLHALTDWCRVEAILTRETFFPQGKEAFKQHLTELQTFYRQRCDVFRNYFFDALTPPSVYFGTHPVDTYRSQVSKTFVYAFIQTIGIPEFYLTMGHEDHFDMNLWISGFNNLFPE